MAVTRADELESQLVETEAAWQKKLDQQSAVNRNLQSDLTLVYAKNKRELARLEEEYRHADYKARYASLLARSEGLESRVEKLQVCRDELQR
jgi:hypothetical protein